MPRTIAHIKDPRTTKQRQDDFLDAFEELANIKQSCKKSNVPRRTFYDWLDNSPKFKERYKKSETIALSVLEDEAYRRAVEGVKKPVWQGGKKMGTIKEFSDTLLIVLLKARAPEKYKDRVAKEVSGPDGTPIKSDTTHHVIFENYAK